MTAPTVTRARIHPGDGDPRHGTTNGYSNLGCRGPDCREANRVARAVYRGAEPGEAPERLCPWCGPYGPSASGPFNVCPSCGLDAGEVAYAERIIALGGAEVYRQDYEAARAKDRPMIAGAA